MNATQLMETIFVMMMLNAPIMMALTHVSAKKDIKILQHLQEDTSAKVRV